MKGFKHYSGKIGQNEKEKGSGAGSILPTLRLLEENLLKAGLLFPQKKILNEGKRDNCPL